MVEVFFVVGADVKPDAFGVDVADGGAEGEAVACRVVGD